MEVKLSPAWVNSAALVLGIWFVLVDGAAFGTHEKKKVEIQHPAEYKTVTKYKEEKVDHPAEYKTVTQYREEKINHPAEYKTVTKYKEEKINHPAEYKTVTKCCKYEGGKKVSYQEQVLVKGPWTETKKMPYEEQVLVKGPWTETKKVPYEEQVLVKKAWTETKSIPYEEKVVVKEAWTETKLEPIPHAGGVVDEKLEKKVVNVNRGNPRYGGEFYGNWCGPDWSGGVTSSGGSGAPVDDLDRQCRFHDLAYAGADAYWKPIYDKAKTAAARKQACDSWLSVYRSADVALTEAGRALPSLVGTIHPTRPDAWNFDPTVFGRHPRTTGQRNDYRVSAVISGNLGLFKKPPCNSR